MAVKAVKLAAPTLPVLRRLGGTYDDLYRALGDKADDVFRKLLGRGDELAEIDKALERIRNNGPFPYNKDGTVFKNRPFQDGWPSLPHAPRGKYREYTVETPGLGNRGKRRLVVNGDSGSVYFTRDHYESFKNFGRY